ncbi:MAG: hypothetical protein HW392_2273 [Steroidobacteraceae bacterium]|nr:hypothetical protein [Steroidobacteraceae bacterium]
MAQGRLERAGHFSGVQRQLKARADETHDRRLAIAADHDMIRQAADHLDELAAQADFFLSLAQSCCDGIVVTGFEPATGE